MNKKFLCIVPARQGSKGIKNKNIVKLNKLPLLAWTIKSAKKSKYIKEIIVSTDSKKIANIAKKYGGKIPFLRPKKYSTDKASSFDVLKHAINFFKSKKINYDYVVMLEPTSPLRSHKDIDFCLKKVLKDKIDTIVGVSKVVDQHPLFLYSINKKNILVPYVKQKKKLYIRRQDINPLYYLEGSVYVSKISTLLKEKTWYHKKTQPYIVDQWKALEIDDTQDLQLAEFYIKKIKK
jgi:N-acylneuraminate cytidylyltransferase/CMP-N,N'-diacetyllegionaminic acid synthase